MYIEYYEPIDFITDFKTQDELDAAITTALHSKEFVTRFAKDSDHLKFLKWDDVTGHKVDYQKSHYLSVDDIRFNFIIDIRNKNVEVNENENGDQSSEIGNPGDSLEYLSLIISKVISKTNRTYLVSDVEGENYGYAVGRNTILTLDFTARVLLGKGKQPIPLPDWIQNKENK